MTQTEYITTGIAVIILSVALAYLVYELMTRNTNHKENLFTDLIDDQNKSDHKEITFEPKKKRRIWGKARKEVDRNVRQRQSLLMFGESVL